MTVIEPPPGGEDITAPDALIYRLRQQSVLADFGIEALRAREMNAMLQRAAEMVAGGMRSKFSKFLEYRQSDDRLLVRAGVGWGPGVVGSAEISSDNGSPAGFAFKTGEAVISNHLENEQRFRTPAFMAAHHIRRAINVLVEAGGTKFGVLEVDSPDEGEFEAADLSFMRGFANLIGVAIERQLAEAKLKEAIAHQKLLIREASHRVKNSLSMVSAMLNLQMQGDDDPRVVRLLGDAQARITTIAKAHDQLWRGNTVGIVALDELIGGIVEGLQTSIGGDVECRVPRLLISADTAIPIGLVVTELVTNAIKYAGSNQTISVLMQDDGENINLTVSDHGPGLPVDFELKSASRESLGMRIISSLVRQLGGSIFFENTRPGTRVSLLFPNPNSASAPDKF